MCESKASEKTQDIVLVIEQRIVTKVHVKHSCLEARVHWFMVILSSFNPRNETRNIFFDVFILNQLHCLFPEANCVFGFKTCQNSNNNHFELAPRHKFSFRPLEPKDCGLVYMRSLQGDSILQKSL